VFRNFPLQEAHPAAYMAALAAEAAGMQGKFWLMHDLIYENQRKLSANYLLDLAARLELDLHRFAADWKNPVIKEKVESDFEGGLRSGVNGTPTFFVNNELFHFDGTYQSLLQAVAMV
jgi:protein-disulfide isomerase